MAEPTEDVIELGSSDDEAEPAPKKMKRKQNAMVHIPNMRTGVNLKSKPMIPTIQNVVGKGVTFTKVNISNKNTPTNKSTQNALIRPVRTPLLKPVQVQSKTNVNPVSLMKQLSRSQVMISKVPSTSKNNGLRGIQKTKTINHLPPSITVTRTPGQSKGPTVAHLATGKKPVRNFPNVGKISNLATGTKHISNFPIVGKIPNFATGTKPVSNFLNVGKIPNLATGTKPVSNFPNVIAVKASHVKIPIVSNSKNIAVSKTKLKRSVVNVSPPTNVPKRHKPNPSTGIREVFTVELDDDEVAASTESAGPSWYLRPEEQTEEQPEDLEKKNNAEPEPAQFIEITIEDSPGKPLLNRRTCEIGTELTITIDDSPVKHAEEKPISSGSDDEGTVAKKVPYSKKKLDYPKETTTVEPNTIEIEIEPIEVDIPNPVSNKNVIFEVVEVQDSPAKNQVEQPVTPKKQKSVKPNLKVIDLDPLSTHECEKSDEREKSGEFHPVYQRFIDQCFEIENSDDMKKIVDKKIKAYYRQVPKEYTESEYFIDMVASKVLSMKAGPEKMYLYIKDIVDELNMQRKMAKSQSVSTETKSKEPEPFLYGEDSEFDSKRQRQIRKLEKTLKKLHRAIQKLEVQEVDFDDEDDSVYLLTESDDGSYSNKDNDRTIEKDRTVLLRRYKERMVRVHAKFCQLTNTKMPSEPRVQIDARPGQPSGPAKRLEKWVNKKVPIGTPLPFPDFHDVLRCVRDANEEDKLGWNEADIMEQARDLFTRCGKKLQRRRQENEWRSAASRITLDIDPAEGDYSLNRRLEENKQIASKKETEVFNKYADRQSQLKLEAEEIGDKEAEESPVESEDDEPTEDGSLENKEKRKDRLRRLIQEKSKKTTAVKSSKPIEEKDQSDDKPTEDSSTNKYEKTASDQKERIEAELHMTIDSDTADGEDKVEPKKVEKIHSISDGSEKVDSYGDELHLLQKLHSGNEVNSSTLDSSDTDNPTDNSDMLQSSSDNKRQPTCDVISIENSSYSESEANPDTNKADEVDCTLNDESENDNAAVEILSSGEATKGRIQINNDEYEQSVENILLASSDDDADDDDARKDESPENAEISENLKDDTLFIGDKIIQGVDLNNVASNNKKINMVATPDNVNKTETTDLVSIENKEFENVLSLESGDLPSIEESVGSNSEKGEDNSSKNNNTVTIITSEDEVNTTDNIDLVSNKNKESDKVLSIKSGDSRNVEESVESNSENGEDNLSKDINTEIIVTSADEVYTTGNIDLVSNENKESEKVLSVESGVSQNDKESVESNSKNDEGNLNKVINTEIIVPSAEEVNTTENIDLVSNENKESAKVLCAESGDSQIVEESVESNSEVGKNNSNNGNNNGMSIISEDKVNKTENINLVCDANQESDKVLSVLSGDLQHIDESIVSNIEKSKENKDITEVYNLPSVSSTNQLKEKKTDESNTSDPNVPMHIDVSINNDYPTKNDTVTLNDNFDHAAVSISNLESNNRSDDKGTKDISDKNDFKLKAGTNDGPDELAHSAPMETAQCEDNMSKEVEIDVAMADVTDDTIFRTDTIDNVDQAATLENLLEDLCTDLQTK